LIAQLMLVVGKTAVEFIRRWILLFLSTRINISILSDFLTKLVQLPISFFDQKMIGDLLKRIDDHSRVERFLSTSSLNMIFSFFNLIIFGIVLVIYSLPVFFIFFGCSVVYLLYVLIFMRKRKELDYKHFSQMAQNQANLIQLIQGMQEIKLNTCERQKRWEWEKVQAKLFAINLKSITLQQYQEAGGLFINEFKNIFITIVASQAVINGDMTLGMMMAITFIIGQLNGPINEFIAFLRDYQDAKISLERIGEIHALENENTSVSVQSDGNNVPAYIQPVLYKSASENGLTLSDVTFRYGSPQMAPVLDNINLFIPEGKVTAIVGVSGSGKTTLLKLLLKFYPVTAGEIRLSGTNIKMFTNSDWRKKCGAVMQDGYIFFDTIARNIAMSDEVIDPDKLLQAVTTANIRDFVEGLPLGYNTKIGDDGVGYSQGQKQRLMIARAVYKNPQYLFFDEATSSLDANNERVIMENLNEFFKGRTVVIIAHRLSTVKNADQIVVLDKGKIVEVGNHESLVAKKGSYFALVKNQLELGN
jgi:ATP-binding cassette subfamily B protein